jgi:integrase
MLYAQDIPADSPSRATRGYHIQNLLPYWGEKTLADVKGSTCRSYLKQRVEGSSSNSRATNGSSSRASVKPSTARQELKTLQAAINHWHKESPLAAVPQVTLPKAGSPRERVLSRSEAAKLLWAARRLKLPHVARFIIIGIETGTRHAAILKLRWDEDNDARGSVDLQRGIIFRRGNGEKETSKRRPPVRVGRRLLGYLVRWSRRDADQGFLNIIHWNGQPILKMKRAWAHVVREAGLGRDVTPHTLRHTCASWLLAEGRTIWDVAGILGADASTIERVYGHYMPIEERRRA